MFIYIYMCICISEVGGVSPTGRSFPSFVRVCVQAKLRVPARRCCFCGGRFFAISALACRRAARVFPFR